MHELDSNILDLIINSTSILGGFFLTALLTFDDTTCVDKMCTTTRSCIALTTMTTMIIFISGMILKMNGKDYLGLTRTIIYMMYLAAFLVLTTLNVSVWDLTNLTSFRYIGQIVVAIFTSLMTLVAVILAVINTVKSHQDNTSSKSLSNQSELSPPV